MIINKKNLKIIFILLFQLLIIPLFFNNLGNNYYKIKLKKEILNIEQYFQICNEGIILNKNRKRKKIENPIISIISTVYNNQDYILRFLRSIQNQDYDKIEIILIDDFSEDNTVDIIENYQKEDERVILIKHQKNKGTLISRNEGIIISKGKYILIPDSDDILSKDILNQCLIIEEKKNYDIIRFNIYFGKKNIFMYKQIKYLVNKSIYQPELSSYIFYGRGKLEIIDPMISNKFIKRHILINAINSINNYYLNQYMIFYEDTLINFMLYKVSKSYYYLKNIGYFYILNSNSSTMGYSKNEKKINKFINSLYLFLKFIFEYTKNNKYEKLMANEVIKKQIGTLLSINMYKKKNKNYKLIKNVINLYINNKFIPNSTKKKINNIIEIIKK